MAEDQAAAPDAGPSGDHHDGPFRPSSGRDGGRPAAPCRFLARETGDGLGWAAGDSIDPANRCIALGDPIPQSPRQQDLVCLTSAHETCPRYLRGVLLAGSPAPAPARRKVSRPVVAASLVLAAALAASFGFLAVRGGFDLLSSSAPPVLTADLHGASPSVVPTPGQTATPTPTFVASQPAPSPSAAPTPGPSPTPTPAPTVTPTAAPTPPPTARPRSDRFAVLTACPSTPNCWIYVIRAGDNLQSIAHWFGVPYSRIIAMNPGLRLPIQPGERLRIPTPTR